MITLTPAAEKQITKLLSKRGKGVGIRLGVKTTGCSGMAYTLEYLNPPDVFDPAEERIEDLYTYQRR